MYNKRITSVILAVVFTLVLFSCPDPFHITDEATLIINLGGGGRAVTWQHDEDPSILDELIYTITLTGPGDITINHTLTEGKTSITEKVAPGIWLVEVKALYEGVLYAEGEDYVDVIAGQKKLGNDCTAPAGKLRYFHYKRKHSHCRSCKKRYAGYERNNT